MSGSEAGQCKNVWKGIMSYSDREQTSSERLNQGVVSVNLIRERIGMTEQTSPGCIANLTLLSNEDDIKAMMLLNGAFTGHYAGPLHQPSFTLTNLWNYTHNAC